MTVGLPTAMRRESECSYGPVDSVTPNLREHELPSILSQRVLAAAACSHCRSVFDYRVCTLAFPSANEKPCCTAVCFSIVSNCPTLPETLQPLIIPGRSSLHGRVTPLDVVVPTAVLRSPYCCTLYVVPTAVQQ